jgi:hypothetical protein
MLLEVLTAQSGNSDIFDSKTDGSDTSENEYVPSKHSDQEESDHVSTRETDSDGDNVTASGGSDADSETNGCYEEKWKNLE